MMIDIANFNIIVIAWIVAGIIILPLLFFIAAPYGRHIKSNWGITINNKAGWFIMELPSVLLFAVFFFAGELKASIPVWIFFGLWELHYIHRVFVFPFQLKTKGKKMPLAIVIFAFFFNLVNAFINGYFLGNFANGYYITWLCDPRFIIGLLLFVTGMGINWHSDEILFKLRKPSETGYKIPFGGLFKYISCPNYFGEIVEWTGFAIMAWNLPALSFIMWTLVNLLPRAFSHHKWYKEHFADYPKERKALIPFV